MAKVLVVEDNLDLRDLLRLALKGQGHQVDVASNGQEALDRLAVADRPHVILLDLMMPVMNGWEFLQAKAADPDLSSIPVIVLSAVRDGLPDTQAVLKKPVQLPVLFQTIRSVTAAS